MPSNLCAAGPRLRFFVLSTYLFVISSLFGSVSAFAAELPCANLAHQQNTHIQIQTVLENPKCSEAFIDALLKQPETYLQAFYTLIHSDASAESIWWAVFLQLQQDQFRFPSAIIDDLHENLPRTVELCAAVSSCGQWDTFVLPALEAGELYRCPDMRDITHLDLRAVVPYGDYFCTELLAARLGEVVTFVDIHNLMRISTEHSDPWARRNALRIIGRIAEQPKHLSTRVLIRDVLAIRMRNLLSQRLSEETSEEVLLEAVWILDTFYFPSFDAKPALEMLVQNEGWSSDLRFRGMAALTRLLQEKASLSYADLRFFSDSLVTDDPWVRGYAAFAFETMRQLPLGPKQESQIVDALRSAFGIETEFSAKASMAQAIDAYTNSTLLAQIQRGFEEEHLDSRLAQGHITIRSGLPKNELPALIQLMEHQEKTFFELFGESFRLPVLGSSQGEMELILFADQSAYQTYMDAFIGYGADAGGLYFESENRLYTYQRRANESYFTVEHLIQHEFTHYLMGRYVFPGLWSDPGYHREPKGWVDEGTAEFFAEISFEDGEKMVSFSADRFANVCENLDNKRLINLVRQRVGYDEPGTFDYDFAWVVMTYLIQHRRENVVHLFNAFREDTYHVEALANIMGTESIETLEGVLRSNLSKDCILSTQEVRDTSTDILNNSGKISSQFFPSGPTQGAINHRSVHHEYVIIQRNKSAPVPAPGQVVDARSLRIVRLVEP